VNEKLHRRVREAKARVAVRAWQYRQRRHAAGVWMRLRRVLADASEAYAIPPEAMEALVRDGCVPEPVGRELEPAKMIVFADPGRPLAITERKQLAVRLSAELLAARYLALVRFPET